MDISNSNHIEKPKPRGKFANTWHLAKISWAVLRKDRELLFLPVLSLFFIIVVCVAAFLVVMLLESTTSSSDIETAGNVVEVVWLLATMIVGIIAVFFQGALVAGAHERMTGGDPTVSSAIQTALKHISRLVPWAIITTTVGLLFRVLKHKSDNFLVRLLLNALEGAWEVVAFLTVPAIVIDGLGPIKALKRSARLLRKTWGENVIASVGFWLLAFVLVIKGILAIGSVTAVLYLIAGTVGLIVGVAVTIAYVVVLSVCFSALNAVYQTGLYIYAITGEVPNGFEEAEISEKLRPKIKISEPVPGSEPVLGGA